MNNQLNKNTQLDVKINKSDQSFSCFIIENNKIALAEFSIMPCELVIKIINETWDDSCNRDMQEVIQEVQKYKKHYFFNRLNVPKEMQYKGVATELLKHAHRECCEQEAVIINTANAYGSMNQKHLISLYEKSGQVLLCKEGLLIYSKTFNSHSNVKLKTKM